MNISYYFKERFEGNLSAVELDSSLSFPYVFPYSQEMLLNECLNRYIKHQIIVMGSKEENFTDPTEDKTLHSEVLDQLEGFVFQPDFFQRNILHAESSNALYLENGVQDFQAALTFNTGQGIIECLNKTLSEPQFHHRRFSDHLLKAGSNRNLTEQYRAFLVDLEYECLKDCLLYNAGNYPVRSFNPIEFREYMRQALAMAHIAMMKPY